MKIVLATNNKHKVKEIKNILSGLNVEILTLEDFPNFPKIKESGKTLEENAILKAKAIQKFTELPSLADDSGLEVDFLQGAPGVKSARFAGKNPTYKDNNVKLLRLLKDLPRSKRRATFRCVACLAWDSDRTEIVEGRVRGIITKGEIGEQGFGYDPVFYYPKLKKTFAQLSPEEKNKISHRYQAFQKIKKLIQSQLAL